MIKLKVIENSVFISSDELELISDLCFIYLYITEQDSEKHQIAEELQEKIEKFLRESKK